MNKYNIIFLLFFAITFTACGQKTTALNHFEKDPVSANAIQHTKKRDLIHNNEQKAMFFITYLNKSDKKYKSSDLNSFIVGIHMINSEKHSLEENNIKVSMNNEDALNIKEVDKESNLIKSIPLKNKWAKYYIIDFKNKKKVYKLNLKFTHPQFGQAQASFDR